MSRIRIIRHGDASTSSDASADPSLNLNGVRQALELPGLISNDFEQLLTSPLIRARETALPLSAAFGHERVIVDEYGELPWREGQTTFERADDLVHALGSCWSDLRPQWRQWREQLIERVLSERGDVLVVSHFVAINVLVGFATRDDRTCVVRPANASITEFVLTNGTLSVSALGEQIPQSSSHSSTGSGH